MKVFVLTGHSESGDDYGPLVFSLKPTNETLRNVAHNWEGDEDNEGEGDFGSWVYLTLHAVDVDSTVEPEKIHIEE